MKKWTKDEEELLSTFINNKWLHKDIANELGRSISSIERKTKRLCLKSKNNTAVLKTHEQYVKDLKERCPTMIPLEKYNGLNTKILHKCLNCTKEYLCSPISKMAGWGCRYCGRDSNCGDIPIDKQGITYLVYIPKFDLYKFGITSKTTKERMFDGKITKYELILEHKFDLGIDAINLEKQWKENLKEYLVNTGVLNSGNTETFRI